MSHESGLQGSLQRSGRTGPGPPRAGRTARSHWGPSPNRLGPRDGSRLHLLQSWGAHTLSGPVGGARTSPRAPRPEHQGAETGLVGTHVCGERVPARWWPPPSSCSASRGWNPGTRRFVGVKDRRWVWWGWGSPHAMAALAPTFHLPQDRQSPQQIQAMRAPDPGGAEELGVPQETHFTAMSSRTTAQGGAQAWPPRLPQLEVEALGRPTQLHFTGPSTPRSAEGHPEVFAGF